MKQIIFISYGSGDYLQSLKRIGKEASRLRIFSKVILYKEKDLPSYIMSSPLKAYKQGDGYWIWKPYIIWKTLHDYPNSIVVYADSGCVLKKNYEEWQKWFQIIENYDTIGFQYRKDFPYSWSVAMNCSCRNVEWTKKSLINLFDGQIDMENWLMSPQLLAGLVIAKGSNNPLISMWLDISIFHPELLFDCIEIERNNQNELFICHRHDQSVWSIICEYWRTKENTVKLLPETAESRNDAAVIAARIKRNKEEVSFKTRLINLIRKLVGNCYYDRVHYLLKDKLLFKKIVFQIEYKCVRK